MIDSKLAEIKARVEAGEEVSGFLASMLLRESLSVDDLYANISELMLAAVDTVCADVITVHTVLAMKHLNSIFRLRTRCSGFCTF